MTPYLLEVRGVSRRFGGVRALTNLSLNVAFGEVLGLIGPNGSGKTTTFNVITGVFAPSDGDVTFMGRRISGFPSYAITKLGIARTFQNIRMLKGLTVLDNVLVAAHLHHKVPLWHALVRTPVSTAEERRLRQEARELLDIFGVLDRASEVSGSLPYATQRRVEIARALATHPQLLLLDEPTAGMTPAETRDTALLLKEITRDISAIVIEHDLKFVREIASRITVLHKGAILTEGPIEEIANNLEVRKVYLGRENL